MRSIILFAAAILIGAGMVGNFLGKSEKPRIEEKAAPAASAAAAGPRTVSLQRDWRGHFLASGRIDGRQVSFMVDTGASVIALSEREANRLGIHPGRGDFNSSVRTANGVVRAAAVTLKSVDVGGLVVRNVQALVVPGAALGENLLGLSYLTKLKRFEYANGRLILEN